MSKKEFLDLVDGKPICNDGTFDLTNTEDLEYINNLGQEALQLGGAKINVFKLLGIHEQGQLVDLAGNGTGISSSFQTNFPPANVFNVSLPEWKSGEKGDQVIQKSFLGYDFGPIKFEPTGRNKYGIDTKVKYHITTIKIKQACDSNNRITKARVEYSLDGSKWFGADIINLPDNNDLNQISLKSSAPARYWRLRPLAFNGGTNDSWKVHELQLIDYRSTDLNVLQDEMGFLEARDRDYDHNSIQLRAYYDLIDVQTELSRFGIELPSQQLYMQFNFIATVQSLGRPLVIGDILEIPSEAQFSAELKKILKYLEVTDVAWSTEGYTPGWQPTMLRIVAQPMLASQETLDIIGDFAPSVDETGLFDIDDSNHSDLTDQNNAMESAACTNLPQSGQDSINIEHFSQEEIEAAADQGFDISKLSTNPNALYVEDGIPPNGEPYTEGDEYPQNPTDKQYHRLTYSHVNDEIPPRLYQYSIAKGRWVFCETDRRFEFNGVKPKKQEFLTDPSAKPLSKI